MIPVGDPVSSVGISRMFTRLLDCSVAYQECREALSIQTKNRDSVKSQPGLVLFEDYANGATAGTLPMTW